MLTASVILTAIGLGFVAFRWLKQRRDRKWRNHFQTMNKASNSLIVLRSVMAGAIVGAVMLPLLIGYAYYHANKPQTFDQWLTEHEKTCPQCGGDDSNGPPALCEEAFEKLQQSLIEMDDSGFMGHQKNCQLCKSRGWAGPHEDCKEGMRLFSESLKD